MSDQDYVYDEASAEWFAAGAFAEAAGGDPGAGNGVEVRDAVGNLLAHGDHVTLIKNLTVKGAGQTLKCSTLIKSICLTDDSQKIDRKHEGIKRLVLRVKLVPKR